MQTIVSKLDRAFRDAIRASLGIDGDPLIAPAQNEKFGDYQSNAAMGLSKAVAEQTGQKTNPRAIAEQILAKLDLGAMTDEKPTIAGPGFINVRLSPRWLSQQLETAAADERLGVDRTERPKTVVVDYSAPNIAKEMHVGHIRSTIIGDAVARLLAFQGHDVIRQNHLGDWGTQFGRVVLAMWYEAAFQRTGQRAKFEELMRRPVSATVVRELATFHQRFVNEDHDGERYFVPYLREDTLDLDELENAYKFVSAVTDTAEAAMATIDHPTHGPRTLAELPRLVTRFIQDPDAGKNRQEQLAWEKARRVTMDACVQVYRRLGVQLADPSIQREPLERGESFYNPFLEEVVRELKAKGLAVESEGAIVVRVPGYEAPLVIEKADGGYLYGTTDLAAVRFRVHTLGASRVVYFVDARQSQHFAQVFWTARQASFAGDASLEHAAFGTMLGKDGKPFKTRAGDTVKLRELIDEAEERALAIVTEKNPDAPESQRTQIAHSVGVGAVKYADLSKDRTSDYVFDWDKMLSFDGNTAPYLQYAYARIRSIFRKAGTAPRVDSISIASAQEAALARHILRLGEIVESVARELRPHILCNYLYELSTKFSAFYENCPVLQSVEPVRSSRLALCDVTARTLALGLDLLGIEHPEQM